MPPRSLRRARVAAVSPRMYCCARHTPPFRARLRAELRDWRHHLIPAAVNGFFLAVPLAMMLIASRG
jgi:hypothetical protein